MGHSPLPPDAASTPDYQHRHRLTLAFDQVIDRLTAVAEHVSARRSRLWRFHPDPALSEADWLRQALLDMWHLDGQDGRETRNYIGLVAADPVLIEKVSQANAAKQALSLCLQDIKAHSTEAYRQARHTLPRRHPDVESVMESSGLARLHLKQCWRQLPIAEAPVSRVRLAWYSSGRSIKRMSVRDAEAALLALDSEAAHVRIQLRRLAGIPDSECLAQVQTQAPLMRANLFYVEPLEDGHDRRALNAAMPIFVPENQGRLPHVKAPAPTPPTTRTRARRRDEKLESEPFLPSLRVYRYRQAQ